MNVTVSSESDHEFRELLEQARKGDLDALGRLIDCCRPYLMKVAHDEGNSSLQGKVGDSDLVQYACLDAVKSFGQFRGRSSKEMLGWLRQILVYRLSGVRDQYHAEKRNVNAERPMVANPDDSREDILEASTSSPSDHVVRQEEREVLELALRALSASDRTIIELRHIGGHAFAEIARQLHLTEDAARKRWVRAIQALQEKVRRLYGFSSG